MPSEIKIRAGNFFSSDADALVVSIDKGNFSLSEVQQQLREHWQIDIPISGTIVQGDFIASPIRNASRKDNHNPVNFLLFTNFGSESKQRFSNFIDFIPSLAAFSKENSTVREIGIQMDYDWADFDRMHYLFDHLYQRFFTKADQDCSIEIFFHLAQDSERATEFLRNYLNIRKTQLKFRGEYQQESAKNKLLSKRFYILRGFAGSGKEWINRSDSLLRDHDDESTRVVFREVPVGSLLFLSSSVSSSMEFFPVSAIGEVIENLNGNIQMSWFSQGFTGHVKNLEYPLRSINELLIPSEKGKMYDLLKVSFFTEFTDEALDMAGGPQSSQKKNVELTNDNEIGEDYLDIVDDVDAFARIIALRDLRPPLAIALCGKWGSGKSFFMGKMIDKIRELSSRDSGPFCQGILHIKFNAWSYLDSSLWAGIVTKIFNGINEYVNEEIESQQLKNRIKKELQEKLSLSQQSVFKLEAEKKSLSQHLKEIEKEKIDRALNLKLELRKLEKKSYVDFFNTAITEFAVEKQIDDALAENKSVSAVSRYLAENYPEELYADGKWLKKEASRWKTFWLDFSARERIIGNLWWLILICLTIWLLPLGLKYLTEHIKGFKFTLSRELLASIGLIGALSKKIIQSYKKIQPLFSSLWQVKKRYLDKVEETKHLWQQQEAALKAQIAIHQERIIQLDSEISQTKIEIGELEHRLLNKLNTEAFHHFIKDKSGESGYRKHQGIVATIRDDFETLSTLFEGYALEWRAQANQDPDKLPLERIVLYIDDLDRCGEARVLEVLEAVHLIMAFNLFVVVVGIDPGRVKSALANQLSGRGRRIDQVVPSKYLEKIFQVPFQLNAPSDKSVKKMLNNLFQTKNTKSMERVAEQEFEENDGPRQAMDQDNVQPAFNPTSDRETVISPLIEKLLMDADEVKRISDFSVLLGFNPRSVKRFVNILRIIRAHTKPITIEEVTVTLGKDIFSFLLALSLGPANQFYHHLNKSLKNEQSGSLSELIESISGPGVDLHKSAVGEFLKLEAQRELSLAPIETLSAYNLLVSRFSFDDHD